MIAGRLLLRDVSWGAFWGAILGAGIGLSYFVAALPLVIQTGQTTVGQSFAELVGGSTSQIVIVAVLLSFAFRYTAPGRTRVLATILGIVLAIAFHPIVRPVLEAADLVSYEGTFRGVARDQLAFTQWMAVTAGVLIAFYYAHWERAQASARRLHAAQLERQRTQHALLESGLNVVRARIDPAFLFDALGEVGRRYEASVDDAEEVLEDLIAYLRASLPQSRERASTLGGEFQLAGRYLGLAARLRKEPLEVSVEIDEALRAVFFPPMVLMPLVEEGLARGVPGAPRHFALSARLAEGEVRVVLEDDACPPDPARPTLRTLGTTLHAFFGPQARFACEARGAGCVITIAYRLADAATGKEGA